MCRFWNLSKILWGRLCRSGPQPAPPLSRPSFAGDAASCRPRRVLSWAMGAQGPPQRSNDYLGPLLVVTQESWPSPGKCCYPCTLTGSPTGWSSRRCRWAGLPWKEAHPCWCKTWRSPGTKSQFWNLYIVDCAFQAPTTHEDPFRI